MDHLIKFGDTCCLFDADINGYVQAPLTSTIGAPVVVQPKGKDSVRLSSGDFNACLFQILDQDKFVDIAKLGKKVRKEQNDARREARDEQERLHRAKHEKQQQLMQRTNNGFVQGKKKGVNFDVTDDDVPPMKKTIEPLKDVHTCINDVSQGYRDRALAEARDNELEQRRKFATPVHYGDIVQLWNPAARMFLRVSATTNAINEPSSMKVEMNASVDDCSHFRIMPRYKIRSEGDMIREVDEVVFESVRASGQYLHSTDAKTLTFKESVTGEQLSDRSQCPLNDCHEISASVNRGSFKLIQYSRPVEYVSRDHSTALEQFLYGVKSNIDMDLAQGRNLCAGDVIQFFHKDSDGYISAEGATKDPYSGGLSNTPTEDIHMRIRKPDPERPNRLLPPTSATTFFQIEHAKTAHGGPVGWGAPVRLKHLPTQMYLSFGIDAELPPPTADDAFRGRSASSMSLSRAVSAARLTPGGSFSPSTRTDRLKLVELDSSVEQCTLFELHGEVEIGYGVDRFVDNDAYVRIQHVGTRKWLHPTTKKKSRISRSVCDNRGLPIESASSVAFESSDFVTFTDSDEDEDLGVTMTVKEPFVAAMERLKWDNANLMELEMTATHKFDDAFSLRPVDAELSSYTSYLSGFLPFFHRYVHIREQRELSSSEAEEIARQLNELNTFLYVKGLPQKSRTKQLRVLGVIDVLIRMLQAPFRRSARARDPINSFDEIGDHELTEMVMVNVFRILQSFLRGDCRKNELFMCQYGEFLWSLFGTAMKVEPMFNELVRDNIRVIQEVTETEIKRVIDLMGTTDKNPFYLEFLSVLCVCGNDPYRKHQQSIGQLLLNQEGKTPPVFLTDVTPPGPDGAASRVMVTLSPGSPQITLEDFVLTALDEVDGTSSEEYLFLQRQLELFGKLCQGRMSANIELITKTRKYLTWTECFMCATSESETHKTAWQRKKNMSLSHRDAPVGLRKSGMGTGFLPRSLRKIYIDLLINLFVDVGNNRDVLSKVELNYNWDDVDRNYYDTAAANKTQALSGATFKEFPIVRDWLLWELQQVTTMTHQDRYMGQPFNKLLGSMLNLLQHLIKYGYYASGDDIAQLMKPLEDVINGMNDQKEDDSDEFLSESLKSHKSVASVQSSHIENDPDFKETEKQMWLHTARYQMDADGLAVMEAKYMALKCVDSLFNHIFNVRLRFMLADFKESGQPGSTSNRGGMSMVKRKGGPQSVFNIVRAAKDDKAVLKETAAVRRYLKNLSGSCNWILEHCDPGWDITKNHKSDTENATLVEVLLDLSKYVGHYPLLSLSMQLITRLYTAEEDLYTKAVQAIILVTPQSQKLGNELTKMVPELVREGAGVVSGAAVENFIEGLRYLSARCYTQSNRDTKDKASVDFDNKDPGEPHTMNQQIIYNTGIVSTVIDAVKTDGQEPCVLSCCFEFMKAMSTGFVPMQKKVMESLDVLLQAEVASVPDEAIAKMAAAKGWGFRSWQDSMGLAICEIFVGCKETCIDVRPNQVEAILALLAQYSTHAPTFLDALEAIAKVEEYDLPLKRNQLLTIKNLMLHKKSLIDVAYIDDNSNPIINQQRLELLRSTKDATGTANPMLQHYHLSLVNLLSSTCEGENRQVEATCRSIFSLNELVATISDDGIEPLKKTPYLKFLLWVYLNAEGSHAELGTDEIEQDGKLTLLNSLVRLGEAFLPKCYSPEHVRGQRDASATQSVASFVFDAFLPVFHDVSKRHLPRDAVKKKVAHGLIGRLAPVLIGCVSNALASTRGESHLTNFRSLSVARSLVHLVAILQNQVDPNVMRAITRMTDTFHARVEQFDAGLSPLPNNKIQKRRTLDDGADIENERNRQFNEFACKLGKAYGGANIVKDQLDPVKEVIPRYSNLTSALKADVYCEPAGHDETFPLGPEFQFYSRIFTKSYHLSHFGGLKAKIMEGISFAEQGFDFLIGVDHGTDPKLQTEVDTESLAVLVRLWRGALAYQAQADTHEREGNEIVINRTLLAIRAIMHNEAKVQENNKTSHIQAQVVETKAVLPISVLLGATNPLLQQEVLAVSRALLQDGFADTQKAFARHFLSTREETFFIDISDMIHSAETAMKERRELLKQKEQSEDARAKLKETMRQTISKKAGRAFAQNMQGVVVKDTPEEFKSSSGCIRLVFCVLQSMCEGHNAILQNYLRSQPDNIKSFNLVEIGAKFLLTVTEELMNSSSEANDEDSTDHESLVEQCLETLVEFSQGNVQNQATIFNARATDAVNILIRRPVGVFKEIKEELETAKSQSGQAAPERRGSILWQQAEDDEDTFGLGGKLFDLVDKTRHLRRRVNKYGWQAKLDMGCAKLIASQLEANDPTTKALAKEIAKALDIGAVLRRMCHYYYLYEMDKKFEYAEGQGDDMMDNLDDSGGLSPFKIAFQFYSIIVRLTDFTGKAYQKVPSFMRLDKKWREDNGQVMDFCKIKRKRSLAIVFEKIEENCGVIEIMMHEQLQKVHFYIKPEWKDQLRTETKEALLWSVDRGSTSDSARDFTERSKAIIADMKYLKDVNEYSILTRLLLEYKAFINHMVIVLSYVINFLMLLVWKAPLEEFRQEKPEYMYEFWEEGGVFLILWVIHLVFTSLATIAYFVAFPPSRRALVDDLVRMFFGAEALEKRQLKWARKNKSGGKTSHLSTSTAALSEEDVHDDRKVALAEAQDAVFKSQQIISNINDAQLIDRSAYRTQTSLLDPLSFYHLVFLASSVFGYATYGYTLAFPLLHIVVGNQTLSRVIQSVTKNGATLMYVFLLMGVGVYIFNLVVFAFMRKDLDALHGGYCETLAQCFTTSMRYGLLSGGGLGDFLPQENYAFHDQNFARFFFDLLFFGLITTIGLNVVFGIIVDTFSELRDDKYRTTELMNSQCFICGRQSHDFQRYGNGFRHHIRHEHHMWNYLFYFNHLDATDANDYNAIEQFVAEKLFTEVYDFFPINTALCLEKMGDTEEEELQDIKLDVRRILVMLEKARQMEEEEDMRENQARARQIGGGGQMGGGQSNASVGRPRAQSTNFGSGPES
jgi:inositol 1,4,5-triphosphate receptor type 1